MSYTPSYLKRWTRPDSYAGAEWPDYYMFLGQHRDSDSITRSNFICGLKAIGAAPNVGTVQVVRERHWAVGWIEWIAIHKDDDKALEVADDIMSGLEDYPVMDENHWSQLEWDEVHDYWDSMSLRERVQWCKDYDCSIFSARLNQAIPDVIYEALANG